jgi:broad specificity phosphatase PhoE
MEGEGPAYLIAYRARRAGRDGKVAPLALRQLQATDRPVPEAAPAGWREPTASPEIVTAVPAVDKAFGLDLHLVRHGETQSYADDAGLTPRGVWQSRRCGHSLSAEVQDGETVSLLCAPTARALQTAVHLRAGLEDGLAAAGRRARVQGPEMAPEFRNFQVQTPAGLLDPTSAMGEYSSALVRGQWGEAAEIGGKALWLLELGRFWALQTGGGDAIEFWLKCPLLTFEPPAAVVQRIWDGTGRLMAPRARRRRRVICCTHSGPMRAFAAWALGHDAGEPYNVEQVRARVWPGLSRASVTYRGRTQEIKSPPAPGRAAWWQAGQPAG